MEHTRMGNREKTPEEKEKEIEKLDRQGRHRSEWAYAHYDGRARIPPYAGRDTTYDTEVPCHWHSPIKRNRKEPLTKEELDYRHARLRENKRALNE